MEVFISVFLFFAVRILLCCKISLRFLKSLCTGVMQPRNVLKQSLLHTCNTLPVLTVPLQGSSLFPPVQISLNHRSHYRPAWFPTVPSLNISIESYESVLLGARVIHFTGESAVAHKGEMTTSGFTYLC